MNTKRKSNSVVTVQQASETVLEFDVIGVGKLTFDTAKCAAALMRRAAMHGWKQRISDAAAISRNPENGAPASPADKYAAMQELIAHYETGTEEWARRGGGGGGGAKVLTIEAIARLRSIPYAEAELAVTDLATRKTNGDRAATLRELAKAPSVQAMIAEIRAERTPPVNPAAESLLSELGI